MHRFVYMRWAKERPKQRYNLASSSVSPYKLSWLPLTIDDLEINGPNDDGYPPLLEAIAQRYGVPPACVLTTQGASLANHLVCAALLQPGDEVIVEKPTYEALLDLPLLFRAKVKRLLRRFPEGYRIDGDDLRRLLTEKTKLIFLTNLHNPSGALLSTEELQEIGRLAEEVGAKVAVDEIYLEALYEARPPTAFSLGPQFITTSSLTKAYGMGGLRCGWILAEPKLVQRIKHLNDLYGVSGVFVGEVISTLAFSQLDEIAAYHRQYLLPNFQRVQEFIGSQEVLSCVVPPGGIIFFPRIEDSFDGWALGRMLEENYQTSIVPGGFFESPQHFRLACGIQPEDLDNGLRNLGKALREMRREKVRTP